MGRSCGEGSKGLEGLRGLTRDERHFLKGRESIKYKLKVVHSAADLKGSRHVKIIKSMTPQAKISLLGPSYVDLLSLASSSGLM